MQRVSGETRALALPLWSLGSTCAARVAAAQWALFLHYISLAVALISGKGHNERRRAGIQAQIKSVRGWEVYLLCARMEAITERDRLSFGSRKQEGGRNTYGKQTRRIWMGQLVRQRNDGGKGARTSLNLRRPLGSIFWRQILTHGFTMVVTQTDFLTEE